MNVTMEKSNKSALAHFPETETRILLRTIDTPMIEPQNKFTGTKVTTVLDESALCVPQKHDFREAFKRERLILFLGRGEWYNLVNRLCALHSCTVFYFILCYNLFYTDGRDMDHPRVDNSPNPVFIREKILKPIIYPV